MKRRYLKVKLICALVAIISMLVVHIVPTNVYALSNSTSITKSQVDNASDATASITTSSGIVEIIGGFIDRIVSPKVFNLNHVHGGQIFQEWTSTNSLPSTQGYYVLTNDVTISSTWTIPSGTTHLCLDGHGIKMTGSGSVINIGTNTLNIYDDNTTTVHRYSVDSPKANGAGLATVDDSLTSGYKTFVGGYITGGNASNGGAINASVAGGTINLYGGTIIGNKATNGGAINLTRKNATFNMYGGALLHNMANTGGGIRAENVGTPRMSFSGGLIEGNVSNNNYGGAIYSGNDVAISLTGDIRIINNAGKGTGGITCTYSGSTNLYLSGNPVIYGNIDLNDDSESNLRAGVANNAHVCVNGPLGSDAKIGVLITREILNYYDYCDRDPNEVFPCDNNDYVFAKDGSKIVFTPKCNLYFDNNGVGEPVNSQKIAAGELAQEPEAPSSPGFQFLGWYKDKSFTEAWDFSKDTVNEDRTLYAKWIHKHDDVEFVVWDSTTSLPTSSGNYYLKNDVTLSSTWYPQGTIRLCLNGHGIKRNSGGSVIYVNSGVNLSIYDCGSTIHYFDVNSTYKYATNINQNKGNNRLSFNGGYITGGTGTSYKGAGIYVNNGNLSLYGGNIIGNYITPGNSSGAGIYLTNNASFVMYGGNISYNYVQNTGAGIYINHATAIIYDGIISHNKTDWAGGGGISLHYTTAEYSNIDSTLKLYGGTIEYNDTANNYGAIDVNTGRQTHFEIKGSPRVINNYNSNITLRSDYSTLASINITGILNEEALIGLRINDGIFTNGLASNGNTTVSNFVSDNTGKQVRLLKGEAYLGDPHTHDWAYSVTENTITAKCTGVENNTCEAEEQTLTLNVEGKTYDGQAVVASIDASEGWTSANGLTIPNIAYSGNTDAGTYTASITVGGKVASKTFTIEEKSMADEVSATGYTGDYDGKEYGISVSIPDGATIKFSTTTNEFELSESPKYKDASTYTVYYKVTKKNYITVIDSAVVQINPINAKVTIVGNNDTVDYDKTEHIVTGYVATADDELYDVTKDFEFTGNGSVSMTNAGEKEMGLSAEQFANINPNFKTVTFEVTDGYLIINKVDAVVDIAPVTARPIYDGEEQKLVLGGHAEGGTVYYAIGTSRKDEPEDSTYSTEIPTAIELGGYYVWYKVKGDQNHNDLPASRVKVVIAEKPWVILSGTVYQKDGTTPLVNTFVSLIKGDSLFDYVVTDEKGNYEFTAPVGIYSIVIEKEDNQETRSIKLFAKTEKDLIASDTKTESILKVSGTNNNDEIAVGGLNEEALSIRELEEVENDVTVSILMTVEAKAKTTSNNYSSFSKILKNKNLKFYDTSIQKTIGTETSSINTTNNILEITIPYKETNKRGITVYYSDGSNPVELKESDSKEDGTFYIDKENGFIYIYSKRFSTFAIGYTPYYRVRNSVTLGSYDGEVNILLEGKNDEGTYKLENVSLSKVNFADIPKGEYNLTITWEDGVENKLTMPLTISQNKED